MSSARAVRDSETFNSEDWEVLHAMELAISNEKRKSGPAINPVLLVPVILFGLLAIHFLPSGGPPSQLTRETASSDGSLWSSLRNYFPGKPPIQLRCDFHSTGLADWLGSARGVAQDWTVLSGAVRPGRLRLWKPSLVLSDYRFEFQGQIENKAMSWAFRATDFENYYATKIAISRSGPSPSADIVHYAVLNGREQNRFELPLPIQIHKEALYHVRVNVKGDFFTTSVNGQVVDNWKDTRLRAGGVGFFADKGEAALVRWVSVNDNESSFFSRLFTAAFLVAPINFE